MARMNSASFRTGTTTETVVASRAHAVSATAEVVVLGPNMFCTQTDKKEPLPNLQAAYRLPHQATMLPLHTNHSAVSYGVLSFVNTGGKDLNLGPGFRAVRSHRIFDRMRIDPVVVSALLQSDAG